VTAADFRRVLQKKIRIFLKEMVEGKVEYMGILESVSDDKIWVKLATITIEIPLNKVNKAKQVIL
jgi:ribosome maturation factor RimP